jgi:hypothetical protein
MVKFFMFVLSHLGKSNFALLHVRQPGMRAFSLMEEQEVMEEYHAVSDSPRNLPRRFRVHVRVLTTTPRPVVRASPRVEPHGMPPAAIKRRHGCNRIIAR